MWLSREQKIASDFALLKFVVVILWFLSIIERGILMKRIVSILLIMIMSFALCFSSVGCGRDVKDDDKRVESEEKDKNKDKEDDDKDDKDKDDDKDKESEEVTTPEETTSEKNPTEVAAVPENFEPVVIVDDDKCTFTVKGIELDEDWGYMLKTELVNKTSTSLMFAMECVSVNGYMCDPYWACSVEAGQSEESNVTFYIEDLEINDITTVTDIEFLLEVYDNNNWEAEKFIYNTYTVYPFGEDAYRTYDRVPKENELVLLDNDEATMIVTGIGEDDYSGFYMSFYMENKSDMILNFSLDNVSVNGFMNDPYMGIEVLPGKKANVMADWGATALEMTGVETVTDTEFDFYVYDEETLGDEYEYVDHTIIYPYGEEAYQIYEREAQDSDLLLFDNEYASMVITGYGIDDIWGFSLYAYLVNKTDSDIRFDIEEAMVNGIECDPYWGDVVCAGKKAYVEIGWSTYSLESAEVAMEAISNIEFRMEVTDDENYAKDAYLNEVYTINIDSATTPEEPIPDDPVTGSDDNMVLYKGTGYTIPVPKGWSEITVDNAELAFRYDATSNDKFAENFNVMLQDLSAYGMDLEAYKDLSVSQYESMGYTVVSIEKGAVDGIDAYALVTTTNVTVADGSTILGIIGQVFAVHNKTAYVFTFAADEAGYNLLGDEVFSMFTSVDFQ